MPTSLVNKEEFPNYSIAHELIEQIKLDIDSLDELNPIFLIDMMAVVGIQFVIGSDCSTEFIKLCSM